MSRPNSSWQPQADFETLKKRNAIIQTIRSFLAARNLLEVETPLLHYASVTNPYIASLTISDSNNNKMYLQTSPEFAMKRLLAAGSGPIFQICKAFRDDVVSQHHNPEFTMLEWYQPDYDHHKLMDEVDELIKTIIPNITSRKISYNDLFQTHCDISPHLSTLETLKNKAIKLIPTLSDSLKICEDKDIWLDIIMTQFIEPKLKNEGAVFIYNYPKSQASLSRIINNNGIDVAARFELYINGIEIANGFYELTNHTEQHERFLKENKKRNIMQIPKVIIDDKLIEALRKGLPDCSGVALGIDRLIMIALQEKSINNVMSFTTEYANEK